MYYTLYVYNYMLLFQGVIGCPEAFGLDPERCIFENTKSKSLKTQEEGTEEAGFSLQV